MKTVLIIFLLSFQWAFADKKGHRHLKSHVHGSAVVNVAFDGLSGKVNFVIPAESVLGFEHEPKTETEKNLLSQVTQQWESQISQLVRFEEKSQCAFTKESVGLQTDRSSKDQKKSHTDHADFEAVFLMACKQMLKGSTVTVDLTRFSKIKKVEVTFLVDQFQKSQKSKNQVISVRVGDN